ncbi:unnamed protein product [Owenia fusiformis]|uniref:Uncharacterized protein n=1 Tax=Owenia fusiformis TaxID=6347 RepID=A0A8J1TIU2_OWEFU|nr:unnamed protein product [Owenia fusiformis]
MGSTLKETQGRGAPTRNTIKHAHQIIKHVALKAITKKYGLKKRLGQYLGIKTLKSTDRKTEWWKVERTKKKKQQIADIVKNDIRRFYLTPEISKQLPSKKDVIKSKDGTLLHKQTMNFTIKEAYEKYISESEYDVSFTTFYRLKPVQVKKLSETSRKSCGCKACFNVALKAEAIQKLVASSNDVQVKEQKKQLTKSKSELANLVLCQYQNLPDPKCLEKSCTSCGVQNLKNHYKDLLKHGDEEVTWRCWEYIKIKDKKGGEKRIVSCQKKTTSIGNFLMNSLKTLRPCPNTCLEHHGNTNSRLNA